MYQVLKLNHLILKMEYKVDHMLFYDKRKSKKMKFHLE